MRKKTLRNVSICFLFLLVILVAAISPVSAASRSLQTTSVEMDIAVLEDASMHVSETITVDFSGHWDGFYRTIPTTSYAQITNVKVSENGTDYTYNPGTEYGPVGTYLTNSESDGLLIDWSIDANDETRTFVLTYEVVNAVQIHNDVAELYWKFIGDENEQSIGSVSVVMTLPQNAINYVQGEDIRIWGHGPLDGDVSFEGADGILWQVSPLPAKTFLEGRVVMPTALFSNAPSSAYTGKTALSEILDEEQNYADQANTERFAAKFQFIGGAVLLIASIIAVFLLWRKYGRPHRTSFDGEYYRELPASYSPAEANYLMNKGTVTSPAFMATLLDLARRKFLKIEEETHTVDRLLFDKEVTSYRLTRLEQPTANTAKDASLTVLHPHELRLLELLFEDISNDGQSLLLDDIETYTKRSRNFYNIWNSWVALVTSKARKLNFFEAQSKAVKFTSLIGFLLFLLGFFLFSRIFFFAVASLLSGILIMVVPNTFKRRSPQGEEDYAKWKAFKRFLLHFSQMDKNEIPSLIIWEQYLVYAAALGIAKEVLKQLRIVYPDLMQDNYRFGYGWFIYGNILAADSMFHSFDNFSNNIDRSIRAATSRASSGSGGGGGFSGGGGFGGGGGGFGGR